MRWAGNDVVDTHVCCDGGMSAKGRRTLLVHVLGQHGDWWAERGQTTEQRCGVIPCGRPAARHSGCTNNACSLLTPSYASSSSLCPSAAKPDDSSYNHTITHYAFDVHIHTSASPTLHHSSPAAGPIQQAHARPRASSSPQSSHLRLCHLQRSSPFPSPRPTARCPPPW